MKIHSINSLAICPQPVQNAESLGSYKESMPIMELKELKPDALRYGQYKASVALAKERREKAKKAKGLTP